jgi:CRISPR-associated protein Cas2
MRQRYIVTYDVRDPRRLRLVFKTLKGYGEHLQLSVFRCDLDRMAYVTLKAALAEAIHSREDQVLFISLGPTEGRALEAIESLGVPHVNDEPGPTVL